MNTEQTEVLSATMPAGTYVIGDPCYAIPGERWHEWLDAADFMNNLRILKAPIDGHMAIGVGTAYGDGAYLGSDGNVYGVDAGMIGLVPVEVAAPRPPGLGSTHVQVTFDSEIECRYDNGTIILGNIEIPTDYLDDDDDEEV